MNVEVGWKCACMATEAKALVPERLPAHNIVAWVQDVMAPRIAAEHRRLSPMCDETTMEFVKIPVPPSGVAGGAKEP